jgi:DEAD/DEAH box helicase
MVDFNKLLNEEDDSLPIEPSELFRNLVRGEEFQYLRDIQNEVLKTWFARRTQTDTIVKMNTGAGKTLVGLLMLQSSLNEGVGPALYLCPTKQLVEQVVQQAAAYGIRTVEFAVDDNEMPPEFLNCEAILVCTFQKLFNGKSVFGIPGGTRQQVDLGCLLVDDAHSCLAIARETVSISLNSGTPAYSQLVSLFRPALEAQSMGTAASILEGDPRHYQAVPYWAWMASHANVARILSPLRTTDGLKFAWDLMKDNLELCHCVVSGDRIEITPFRIPIERIPSFDQAKRRFFLSATLVDDSVLMKEFGVSEAAVRATVRPKVRGDIGERLILAPRLIDKQLNRELVAQFAAGRAEKGRNVVVLVASEKAALFWQKAGAQVGIRDTVGPMIARLQNTKGNFVVLVNRYDGIDLPGNACRMLIMDGMPTGASLFEQYLMTALPGSPLLKGNQAQRIEQGLGRGVRSGSDFCVVLLTGNDLVTFISWKENQQLLSAETRRQIEIGQALAKQTQEEEGSPEQRFIDLVKPCLMQDPAWKKYHLQKMAHLSQATSDESRLKLAQMERDAIERFHSGAPLEGANIVQKALADLGLVKGPDFGWYLQFAAALTHKADPARAQEMQRRAHEANRNLFKPIEGIKYQKLMAQTGLQASRVLSWVRCHADSNAIPVAFNAVLSNLIFGGDTFEFEQALADLGNMLGFDGQRPEKDFGNGPDVLWCMTDGHYLVQEAKNGAKIQRVAVYKDDVGQLSVSVNWFLQEYGDRHPFTPVLIHPASVCADDAFAPDSTVIHTPDCSAKLHKQLSEFAGALASKAPDAWTVEEVSKLLVAHHLTPGAFRSQFFVALRPAP